MSNAGKSVWGYSTSDIAERWDGACDSREDAIEEARSEYGDDVFYVVEGRYPDPAQAMPDAERILEWMGEHAFDNWGDREGDWPKGVSDDAKSELEQFMTRWAREYADPRFWTAVGEPERIESKPEGAQ